MKSMRITDYAWKSEPYFLPKCFNNSYFSLQVKTVPWYSESDPAIIAKNEPINSPFQGEIVENRYQSCILLNATSIKFILFIKSFGWIKNADREEHTHISDYISQLGYLIRFIILQVNLFQSKLFLLAYCQARTVGSIFYSSDISMECDENISLKASLVNRFLLTLVRHLYGICICI